MSEIKNTGWISETTSNGLNNDFRHPEKVRVRTLQDPELSFGCQGRGKKTFGSAGPRGGEKKRRAGRSCLNLIRSNR